MAEIVNILECVQQNIQASGITVRLEGEQIRFMGPTGSSCLRLVRLYRPSSDDIARAAAPDVLLVLTAPSRKAVHYAAKHNYLLVPSGGYRIVAPGISLIHDSLIVAPTASRQIRLMGKTGVIAESLLLGGKRAWSLRDLAADAGVSPGLAHRVVTRLERQALLIRNGEGPGTTRTVSNLPGLAELWSQEEKIPIPFLRGFLYSASTEALARRILEACPEGTFGGTLAANLYCPVLTRVPPPLRI